MTTVYLNAAYFPGVELLSALATAGILLYGGMQAIQGEVTIGVLVAFVAALNNFFDPIQQLSQLYTTYQAGMAALDKIFELLDQEPDLRRRPTSSSTRTAGRDRCSRTSRSPTAASDALCSASTCTCRPGRRSRWSAPPAPASRRSPSSSRASTTRPRARILVDGHDLREVSASLAAAADGDRAAGGVPVQRHDRREHRLRAAGRDARGRRGRRRARSARTTSSRRSSTATTPRSASAARSCRPASASSSRSPAR